MAERFLSHFTLLAYTDVYWNESLNARRDVQRAWMADLDAAMPRYDLYQVSPSRADADLLLWSNSPADDAEAPARFLECLGKAINRYRKYLRPLQIFWGLTGASSYARGKSAQAIDPLAESRKSYLVVYPFVKTVDWYRTSRDARQGMMNEHIRLGHQYEQITQLLLYSTGLQDQEFVVVYETDDLAQFSDLVSELRATEARRFTERDTPVYTAVYHRPEETLALSA